MTTNKLDNVPHCPNEACNTPLDGFTGINHNERPSVGDITVCMHCAWVLEFQEGLRLDVFKLGDYLSLSCYEQSEIDKAQFAVVMTLENKNKTKH
jgi:hypothetical protein